MKRVGAVLGAVAMVLGALAVRGTFSGGSDAPEVTGGDGIVCPTDLADACAAIDDVRTQPMGALADELIEVGGVGELEASTFVMPAAWARLVIDERARLGQPPILEIDDRPLASSPVVLAIWQSRTTQLETECDEIGWTCLADLGGEPLPGGDRVQAGMPPVDSASGLLVAAAQAGALLDRDDYAANDFDDRFRARAARLADGQRDDALAAMRSRGPGDLTAAAALRADAASLTSNFGEILVVDGGGPSVRADLVVVTAGGGGLDGDRRARLVDALSDAGWESPADGPDGLPAGGVLAAIRTLWNQ